MRADVYPVFGSHANAGHRRDDRHLLGGLRRGAAAAGYSRYRSRGQPLSCRPAPGRQRSDPVSRAPTSKTIAPPRPASSFLLPGRRSGGIEAKKPSLYAGCDKAFIEPEREVFVVVGHPETRARLLEGDRPDNDPRAKQMMVKSAGRVRDVRWSLFGATPRRC